MTLRTRVLQDVALSLAHYNASAIFSRAKGRPGVSPDDWHSIQLGEDPDSTLLPPIHQRGKYPAEDPDLMHSSAEMNELKFMHESAHVDLNQDQGGPRSG